MVAIAYLMPPVVCLFVFYVCGIDTPEPYAWILVSGWAAAGLTHRLCYRNRTKATEYLGAFIWGLFYEEPWTEREVIVETYTDKNGNTHKGEGWFILTIPRFFISKPTLAHAT